MAERLETGAIVKRALAYPYEVPAGSFVFQGEGRPAPDLDGRTLLLAYGANAAPQALARKLAALPDSPLPVVATELEGFEVVYSAHVSPYGAVPATLHPSPGTSVAVHTIHPDAEQLPLLSASEPNYELTRVDGRLAYLSRHGPLLLDAAPVALAAITARGRVLPALSEPEVLELVRAQLAPQQSLDAFILAAVEAGGIAPLPAQRSLGAQTVAKRRRARRARRA